MDSETFISNNSKLWFLLHHYDKAPFTTKTCYITGRQDFFYTTFLSFCLLKQLYTPTAQACDSYLTSSVYLDRHASMGFIYFFLFFKQLEFWSLHLLSFSAFCSHVYNAVSMIWCFFFWPQFNFTGECYMYQIMLAGIKKFFIFVLVWPFITIDKISIHATAGKLIT